MRCEWWLFGVCALAACGGQSERDGAGNRDGSSGASNGGTSGTIGTGGDAAAGNGAAGNAGTGGADSDWPSVCERDAKSSCQKLRDCSPHLADLDLPEDCESSLIAECMIFSRVPDIAITPATYSACVEDADQ